MSNFLNYEPLVDFMPLSNPSLQRLLAIMGNIDANTICKTLGLVVAILLFLFPRRFCFTRSKTNGPEPFKPTKQLLQKDLTFFAGLEDVHRNNRCYVVSDPELRGILRHDVVLRCCLHSPLFSDFTDNPIIYASESFCLSTGYKNEEIVGRNCRFLQGEKTDQKEVARMRRAIRGKTEVTVKVVNYRKNGTAYSTKVRMRTLFLLE
jgi:PAS domain-containing protein